MHDTALDFGALFLTHYVRPTARVLDIGSQDVNGSLRQFAAPAMTYVGVDLAPGKGVDVVVGGSAMLPFEDASFDAVVSSSCLEHDPTFWVSFLEAVRVTKPGGHIYINVPSNGTYHRYPMDCWRFYPDAGVALVKWACGQGFELSLIESFIGPRSADAWNDCVMIFGRPPLRPMLPRLAETVPKAINVHLPGIDDKVTKLSIMTPDQLLLMEMNKQLQEQRRVLERQADELRRLRQQREEDHVLIRRTLSHILGP
jgi:SAM-dependent methyltransferase